MDSVIVSGTTRISNHNYHSNSNFHLIGEITIILKITTSNTDMAGWKAKVYPSMKSEKLSVVIKSVKGNAVIYT